MTNKLGDILLAVGFTMIGFGIGSLFGGHKVEKIWEEAYDRMNKRWGDLCWSMIKDQATGLKIENEEEEDDE